jgi:hypothetical protein
MHWLRQAAAHYACGCHPPAIRCITEQIECLQALVACAMQDAVERLTDCIAAGAQVNRARQVRSFWWLPCSARSHSSGFMVLALPPKPSNPRRPGRKLQGLTERGAFVGLQDNCFLARTYSWLRT